MATGTLITYSGPALAGKSLAALVERAAQIQKQIQEITAEKNPNQKELQKLLDEIKSMGGFDLDNSSGDEVE